MPNYSGKKRKTDTDVVRAIRRAVQPKLAHQRQLQPYGKVDAPERKAIDYASAIYDCDTTGSVTVINLIGQGSDFGQRIGRQVTCTAIQMEGHIQGQLTGNASKCRVMFIWDSQPNGVLATVNQILSNSTAASFMNLNFRDRFKVLMDHNVALQGYLEAANATGASTVSNISFYKRIFYKTTFSGTTATIGDIQTGALLMLTVGDNAPGAGFQLIGAMRLRYIDS